MNRCFKLFVATAAAGCCLFAAIAQADSFRRLPHTAYRVHDSDDACNALVGEARLASGRRAYRWTPDEGLKNVCPLGNRSEAFAISDDGATVAGTFDESGDVFMFLWRSSTGTIDAGGLGGDFIEVEDLSADGNVVVGTGETSSGVRHAFRATFAQAEKQNLQDLGTLGGGVSIAKFVSADGKVVVGVSQIASGDWRVFRWTQVEGMISLGAFAGPFWELTDISDDGSVVAGTWQNSARKYIPFLSIDGSQIAPIPGLDDSYGDHQFVSDDGRIVYGDARVPGVSASLAYRYRVGASAYVPLGEFIERGSVSVEAISGDGKVVGGSAEGSPDNSGFLRVQGRYHGELTSLQRILDKVFENPILDAVELHEVMFLSDDGRTMLLLASERGEGIAYLHIQIDDYPRVIDENYFATRPGANEIAFYIAESARATASMVEANPGNASAEYAAVYADYAQQYQNLAAAIVLDGVDDADSIALYVEYRYQALQMSYYAYANASTVYYESGGLAPFSAEARANSQYAYDYQTADYEDLSDGG